MVKLKKKLIGLAKNISNNGADLAKCKGIFPVVYGEKDSALTNDLEVFMDNVVCMS